MRAPLLRCPGRNLLVFRCPRGRRRNRLYKGTVETKGGDIMKLEANTFSYSIYLRLISLFIFFYLARLRELVRAFYSEQIN